MPKVSTRNGTSKDAAAARIARAKAKRAARAVIRRTRAQRLTMLRKKTRLSRQEFAKRHNLPYGSLQNWEDPKYGGLTKTGAPRVIKALKKEGIFATVKWLLDGVGPEPYVSAAVLLKRMQLKTAGNEALDFEPAEESIMIEAELEMFRHHAQEILHLVAEDGLQIAGKQHTPDQAAQFMGMNCLAETQDGHIAMGTLQQGNASGTFSLQSAGNAFQNATFQSIAPVMWQRRPLGNS